jgi:integrase
VAAYLDLAGRGELRARAVRGDGHSTQASMRIRRDCLQLIAQAAGVPAEIPERPPMPELHRVVDPWRRSVFHHYLEQAAHRFTAGDGRIRLLAMIGVVLDTGARAGELCALQVGDLAEDLSSLRIVRRPQARSTTAPVVERVGLSGPTRSALRHWLAVREGIVAHVQGGKKALWVSVRANHAGVLDESGGARLRPPGMPLQPRGLARAYTRAVAELNVDMAGQPGWQPMPYRLEQLRRAVAGHPPTAGG